MGLICLLFFFLVNIFLLIFLTDFFFSLIIFEVQHSTDLQNWGAFQNLEVDQSEFPWRSPTDDVLKYTDVKIEGGDTVDIDIGANVEIELTFDLVNAKGIKITVLDPSHSSGLVYLYEVYIYEPNAGKLF